MGLVPWAKKGEFIPLLSDFAGSPTIRRLDATSRGSEPIRFIYAGTHQRRRELDLVLEAVVAALRLGCDAEFCFVGGSEREIRVLRETPGVDAVERRGEIVFKSRIPRAKLAELLRNYDVGISAIPPDEIYREASPTKLAEYMGCGLAVLATDGIPLQEDFVNRSGAGMVVKFELESLARAICSLCENREQLEIMKERALGFAADELRYSTYLPLMRNLLK